MVADTKSSVLRSSFWLFPVSWQEVEGLVPRSNVSDSSLKPTRSDVVGGVVSMMGPGEKNQDLIRNDVTLWWSIKARRWGYWLSGISYWNCRVGSGTDGGGSRRRGDLVLPRFVWLKCVTCAREWCPSHWDPQSIGGHGHLVRCARGRT